MQKSDFPYLGDNSEIMLPLFFLSDQHTSDPSSIHLVSKGPIYTIQFDETTFFCQIYSFHREISDHRVNNQNLVNMKIIFVLKIRLIHKLFRRTGWREFDKQEWKALETCLFKQHQCYLGQGNLLRNTDNKTVKGQTISECLFDFLNFPKNQRKIWQISTPETKSCQINKAKALSYNTMIIWDN